MCLRLFTLKPISVRMRSTYTPSLKFLSFYYKTTDKIQSVFIPNNICIIHSYKPTQVVVNEIETKSKRVNSKKKREREGNTRRIEGNNRIYGRMERLATTAMVITSTMVARSHKKADAKFYSVYFNGISSVTDLNMFAATEHVLVEINKHTETLLFMSKRSILSFLPFHSKLEITADGKCQQYDVDVIVCLRTEKEYIQKKLNVSSVVTENGFVFYVFGGIEIHLNNRVLDYFTSFKTFYEIYSNS